MTKLTNRRIMETTRGTQIHKYTPPHTLLASRRSWYTALTSLSITFGVGEKDTPGASCQTTSDQTNYPPISSWYTSRRLLSDNFWFDRRARGISASLGMWTQAAIMGPAKTYNENVFQPPWECEHRQRSWALPKSTMKLYFSLLGNVNTDSDHGPCQNVQWKCISASLGM